MLLAVISEVAVAGKFSCKSEDGSSPYPVTRSVDHDHDLYAPEERDIVKEFKAYTSSFDGVDDDDANGTPDYLAVPHWVSYELKGVSHHREKASVGRLKGKWYKTSGLSFLWENRKSAKSKQIDCSYQGVGKIWNRGHLAMFAHAKRIDEGAACNTFHFWNAVPQAANMNQGPWRHLEDYTAAAANKYQQLWIIAGPVFNRDKSIGYIGDKNEIPVAVPHALFKIVIRKRETDPNSIEALAFLFPQPYNFNENGKLEPREEWVNCSDAKKYKHIYDHLPRLKSVAYIEELTGLRFFPNASNRNEQLNKKPHALWPVETHYWATEQVCAGQEYVLPYGNQSK